MSKIVFDQAGERKFENGVKNCVLYVHDGAAYGTGVAWNGITTITESPSGAEPTPLYADDIKYLNLISNEEFAATVEAYTYPDEYAECDGSANPLTGLKFGQQKRKMFGLVYKTNIGNDEDPELGYTLHLIYGCKAAPSQKAYASVNDSPEAITFSWELSTTPVVVGTVNGVAYKPLAHIEIDSTKFTGTGLPAKLKALEDYLFGRDASSADGQSVTAIEPQLLLPAQVYEVLSTGELAE